MLFDIVCMLSGRSLLSLKEQEYFRQRVKRANAYKELSSCCAKGSFKTSVYI